ncbi:hypothetical protein D3C74_446100 [compost metagenome]
MKGAQSLYSVLCCKPTSTASLEEIRDVIDLYFIDPSGVQPKQKVLSILRQHLAEADQKIGGFQHSALIYRPISNASSAGSRKESSINFFLVAQGAQLASRPVETVMSG